MKTLTTQLTEEEYAALLLLRKTQGHVLELATLVHDAWARHHHSARRVNLCLQLGDEHLRLQTRTVTFRKAAEAAIESRKQRRKRTLWDFRYMCNRLMRLNPQLGNRRIRSLSTGDCVKLLHQAFPTENQFRKGRAVLSCIFTTAIYHGWCSDNPVKRIAIPRVAENTIYPLTHDEIARLWTAARLPQHRDMQLSLFLLLYCGLRPNEVSRLIPDDVDEEQGCVRVRPLCSKTGGGRVVPLRKVALLQKCPRCIPRRWEIRWRALRRSAGFVTWQRDVCRHTFASYHSAFFHNLIELQWEMGHSNSDLLKTRYLYPAGVVHPEKFWRDI